MGYMTTGEGGFETRINPLVTNRSETTLIAEAISGSVPSEAPASSPSFVEDSSGADASTGFTATEPTGSAENDILLLWVRKDNTNAITGPTGWTVLYHLEDEVNGLTAELLWIRRGAGTPNLAMSWTNETWYAWCITAWRGCASSGNPYSTTNAVEDPRQANPQNPNPPSVSTGVANTTVVGFGGDYNGGSWVAPSGYDLRVGNDNVCVASKEVASAGTEDPGAFSGGYASENTVFEATVALKP